MGIDTNPPAGTLLRFRLPRRPTERVPLARPDGRLHGQPVLLVDDNAAHRDILRRYLSHWGVSGDGVASAREALAALRESQAMGRPYHLAILDLAMPETGGFDLADAIGRDPDIARLPLVKPPLAPPSALPSVLVKTSIRSMQLRYSAVPRPPGPTMPVECESSTWTSAL